jgi:energy-coupling factor transport system ATP-binding protein
VAAIIIEVQGLHHTYGGPQGIEALRGIDLSIAEGEYVAVVGANGSGKSTLARHFNGLLLPTRGWVRVKGLDTANEVNLREIRQTVQMIFQQPDAQIVATIVEEDVAFGPENFGVAVSELKSRVQAALEQVDMWALRGRPPHMLSSGQKQRVAIAGALAVNPRVLVLDEATAMLDPLGRAAVLDLLRSLHDAGVTIITITHEMEEAAEAGRVIVLEHGKIAMDGAPREVFSRVEELRALDLDIPLPAELALRLGLPVCLTADDLLRELGRPAGGAGAALEPAAPTVQNSTSAQPIIQIQDLHHTYLPGSPFESQALRGVSLEVGRGEILGLIGPTGSGKSTLMQHLNGLMRPQQGHVRVDGQDWADPAVKVNEVRRQVGLLFQQPEDQLFERYIGDDIAFGPRQHGLDKQEVRERVQAAMAEVGLDFEAFKDRTTLEISGGERRRVALAGVLALRPQVLVVDEPTAGLDPHGRLEILDILRRLNQQGVTVIMASHRMADVAGLCRRVTALRSGQVAATGSVGEILGRAEQNQALGLPAAPAAELAAWISAAGWRLPAEVLSVEQLADALAPQLRQRVEPSTVKPSRLS